MASRSSAPRDSPPNATGWLDEIDLAPDSGPLAMRTRALGDRPWLVIDDRRGSEVSLKAELCALRHNEVFAALDGTETAGATVEEMVRQALRAAAVSPSLRSARGRDGAATGHDGIHPLDRAGRITQEDLCLLRRRPDGWHLEAGSVCFPSRWRLADKIGRHITAVHEPVDGYAERLAGRVDAMFDRLGKRPVWRRNWFVHPDPALFQPTRPVGGDPVVPVDRVLDQLMLRSERQTIRRVGKQWLVFTIRVQQATLGRFCSSPDRARAFTRWCRLADPASRRHRGLDDAQSAELERALLDG
ncbi:MAG: DUF3445 domain-containing protein [Microthrixaceae bacterium]